MYHRDLDFEILKGKTLSAIEVIKDDATRGDSIRFITSEGEKFRLIHEQDCCEDVHIESIVGDLDDLIDSEILLAEKVTNEGTIEGESATWTFYKLATIKGYVDIRWVGTSNGYYSEEVDFVEGFE